MICHLDDKNAVFIKWLPCTGPQYILGIDWSIEKCDYSVEDEQLLSEHLLAISLLAQGNVHVLTKLWDIAHI